MSKRPRVSVRGCALGSRGDWNQIRNHPSMALDGDLPEGGPLQHCPQAIFQLCCFDNFHEGSMCFFS